MQNVARFFHLPFSSVVNPNIYIIILDSQLLIQGDQNTKKAIKSMFPPTVDVEAQNGPLKPPRTCLGLEVPNL